MWICLNNAFLSVVAVRNMPSMMLVRARRYTDLQTLVPHDKIQHTPNCDYPFRTVMSRGDLMVHLLEYVQNIDYTNFKDSVNSVDLHDAYMKVWTIMLDDYQDTPSLYKH